MSEPLSVEWQILEVLREMLGELEAQNEMLREVKGELEAINSGISLINPR